MTQETENQATPVFHVVLADPEVAYPEMTGDEPCRTTDPESWFPEQGDNGLIAKRMCNYCPILLQCRRWALANPQLADWGIWGGTTRSERLAVRRRETLKALGAAA